MPAKITIAFDYGDDDSINIHVVPRPDPKWLRVVVEGEHALIHIYLPTVALDALEETVWDSWISTIQGRVLGCCNVTATQRQLLLDLALTYRAFTSGNAGVPDIWYTNFVRTLINIARSHDNQPIDQPLTYLTSALRVLLAPTIFTAPDIPPVTDDNGPEAEMAPQSAAGAFPVSHQGGGAPTPALPSNPAPLDAAMQVPPAIPAADPALDAVYRAVHRRTADEGYSSDEETMPSLATVSDSSEDIDDRNDDELFT